MIFLVTTLERSKEPFPPKYGLLACEAADPPPPPNIGVFSAHKEMSSKKSLIMLELFTLQDPKTCFFSIFTQTQF